MTGAADLDRGTGSGWRPVSLGVEHDLEHGGRWTSLATAEREWLWRHPDPRITEARSHARPGDAFVDAGGGEECLPTVQGDPDHGDVWSRPWTFRDGWATASCPGLVERRTTSCDTGQVRVRYEIIGRPGVPFLHAVHLLLDLAPVARIAIPGHPVFSVAGEDGTHTWPLRDGTDQSLLGPDDGTAACLVLPGVEACRVIDGATALDLRWRRRRGTGAGAGLLVWRNLGGWPEHGPYRSIGIEPMLGAGVDQSDETTCSRTDRTGLAAWDLTITALTRSAAGRADADGCEAWQGGGHDHTCGAGRDRRPHAPEDRRDPG